MSTVEQIQRDLACPQCEYNLRGLRGAVVNCPECGCECDIAKMIANRWTQPWHQAPGLSRLYSPTAWLVLAGLFGAPCMFNADWQQRFICFGILFGIWIMLMVNAWQMFPGHDGFHMALVSHAIFAGYIAGVVPFFATLFIVGAALLNRDSGFDSASSALGWLVVMLVLMPLGIYLINLGRRGEKRIAERCIRQYLNRPPRS